MEKEARSRSGRGEGAKHEQQRAEEKLERAEHRVRGRDEAGE